MQRQHEWHHKGLKLFVQITLSRIAMDCTPCGAIYVVSVTPTGKNKIIKGSHHAGHTKN